MKLCLISFSNNADYQSIIYSMYEALKEKIDIYTFGIKSPKCQFAPYSQKNYYFDCPLRPGIEKQTFKMSILFKMASIIKEEKIDCLFFESQHIWNAFLMLLCPNVKKIVVIHDVIPHDGNKAMTLSNFVTGHLADFVILPNKKYKKTLSARYKIPLKKIRFFELWKDFPSENKSNHTGVFLTFGRIRKYKGLENLLEVAKALPSLQFQVIGKSDEESAEIVQRLKQVSNISVLDNEVSDNDMKTHFEMADWIVLPYKSATQSGVIVDAYRYSRPVIAFDVGAISEQIEDGYSGFLVKNEDNNELIKTIKNASELTLERHNQYCHDAYVFGAKKYSANSHAKSFMDLIQELVE